MALSLDISSRSPTTSGTTEVEQTRNPGGSKGADPLGVPARTTGLASKFVAKGGGAPDLSGRLTRVLRLLARGHSCWQGVIAADHRRQGERELWARCSIKRVVRLRRPPGCPGAVGLAAQRDRAHGGQRQVGQLVLVRQVSRRAPPTMASTTSFTVDPGVMERMARMSSSSKVTASTTRWADTAALKRSSGVYL